MQQVAGTQPSAPPEWRPVVPRDGVYLALSGGGFRATAHHLGVLLAFIRSNQHRRLGVVAGVSGGAIAAGQLALWWDEQDGRSDLDSLRAFAAPLIRLMQAGVRRQTIPALFKPNSQAALAGTLDRLWCQGKRLCDLGVFPPLFVFPTTDLSSGFPFFITSCGSGLRPHALWERYVERLTRDTVTTDLSLAAAVAMSAAFPPLFPAVKLILTPEGVTDYCIARGADTLEGSVDRRGRKFVLRDPHALFLTDGGASDNRALSFIVQLLTRSTLSPPVPGSNRTGLARVMAFDAGRIESFNPEHVRRRALVARAVGVADEAKDDQLELLARHVVQAADMNYSIWRPLPELGPELGVEPAVLDALMEIRTDLDRFSDTELFGLIEAGFLLANFALVERRMLSQDLAGSRATQQQQLAELLNGLVDPLPRDRWARHLTISHSRFAAERAVFRLLTRPLPPAVQPAARYLGAIPGLGWSVGGAIALPGVLLATSIDSEVPWDLFFASSFATCGSLVGWLHMTLQRQHPRWRRGLLLWGLAHFIVAIIYPFWSQSVAHVAAIVPPPGSAAPLFATVTGRVEESSIWVLVISAIVFAVVGGGGNVMMLAPRRKARALLAGAAAWLIGLVVVAPLLLITGLYAASGLAIMTEPLPWIGRMFGWMVTGAMIGYVSGSLGERAATWCAQAPGTRVALRH